MSGIFRYPGGKKKVAGYFVDLFRPMITDGTEFHDIFVGGGSIMCAMARQYPGMKMYANDKDTSIYSFWKVIASGDIDPLLERLDIKPTIEMFYEVRNSTPVTLVDYAFRAVFLNKTTFSGMALAGPIGGPSQRSEWGVGCRYTAKNLIKNVKALSVLFKDRLEVTNESFSERLKKVPENGVMYLDPPYFKKGKELYPVFMSREEHEDLGRLLKDYKNWILSIDICPETESIYSGFRQEKIQMLYTINGKKTEGVKKNEMVVFGDFGVCD